MDVGDATRDISLGSRILARLQILDAFGHVSRRTPGKRDSFLMSRSLAPKLVRPDDVLELDLDGVAREDAGARLFLERFIHAEIYRARPDVAAIVHSHAPAVLPFTVVRSERVRPLCHMCGFLSGLPETFDLADRFGTATDLLISDPAKGEALATHLDAASVVLMRGHGFTAVGESIAQATYRAFYTSRNCELQMTVRSLGEAITLSDGEAQACERAVNTQIGRAWNLWVSELAEDDEREGAI